MVVPATKPDANARVRPGERVTVVPVIADTVRTLPADPAVNEGVVQKTLDTCGETAEAGVLPSRLIFCGELLDPNDAATVVNGNALAGLKEFPPLSLIVALLSASAFASW